jgi:hypothetical protein
MANWKFLQKPRPAKTKARVVHWHFRQVLNVFPWSNGGNREEGARIPTNLQGPDISTAET